MMITIKNDHKWPRKERKRPVSSYFTCKVDNEIMKHVIGGYSTLITVDYTNGYNNAIKQAVPHQLALICRMMNHWFYFIIAMTLRTCWKKSAIPYHDANQLWTAYKVFYSLTNVRTWELQKHRKDTIWDSEEKRKLENVRSYYEAILYNQRHILWNLFSNFKEGILEHLLYNLG